MKRSDLFIVLALWGIAVLIYFPVFYTEYLYTDESVQLWMYKKASGFHMFLEQGRYITDLLFQWLFGSIDRVKDVTAVRIFSFAGWMVAIPAWYFILKRIVAREKLSIVLPAFAMLYLVCTPMFSISVSWASCLELFLANTAGLVSGYLLYEGLGLPLKRSAGFILRIAGSLVCGLIALFSYQNGFGCFLLPFLLCLLAGPRRRRTVLTGVAAYFLISAIYFLLFKYSLGLLHAEAGSRTTIGLNPINKLKFFLARPLTTAFHFTYIVNEKSRMAILVSMLLFCFALLGYRWQMKQRSAMRQVRQLASIALLLLLVYLPSLIVKENYSSNRTLVALNMAVFLFVLVAALPFLGKWKTRWVIYVSMAVLFVGNAWYNLRFQFLKPVVGEYISIRAAVQNNFQPGVDTIFFIRPAEDLWVNNGITRSWDEFGVPSFFFEWVPASFVRQIIYEKTGDRELASRIVVVSWLGEASYRSANILAGEHTIVIDAEGILEANSRFKILK